MRIPTANDSGYCPLDVGTIPAGGSQNPAMNSRPHHQTDLLSGGIRKRAAHTHCRLRNGRGIYGKCGFTLVEILVVITIIVVLASIGFMTSRKMISSARTSACLGNLKQLHTIATLEATDRGYYPPGLSQTTGPSGTKHNGDHFSGLTDRLSCTSCPDAKYRTPNPKTGRPISAYGTNPTIIGIRVTDEINGSAQPPSIPLVRPHQITRPSEVFLLSDNAQNSDGTSGAVGFSARWWGNQTGSVADKEKPLNTSHVPSASWHDNLPLIPFRHNGKANIIFVDGHAITINRLSDLKEKNLYWNY
jgi:prepilin-type N-terminal cleavage/methylation domain-containing protein/prepilin-type processing-associated H-X9-DG protein